MDKIKITREQEEALRIWKACESSFEQFVEERGSWFSEFKSLNKFTPEQFALLLCGWHEVEQPFKVGDWVATKTIDDKLKYRKVTESSDNELEFHTGTWDFSKNYIKVTEHWKIMLLELGRDKPEFKEGDRYITVEDYSRVVTYDDSKNYALETAKENRIKYFYPVESRIEVKVNASSK